ncbi:hypothetical protein M422DRAFT_25992 [Sphaerobolus stellatus SS14]|nr:hypothetical protein M422DRAFT_25992 [Sphaerobolus stellatus SS14]
MGADSSVEFLILGAGWTSQFLIPLLEERKIHYAATSRSGRDETLKFEFDPNSEDKTPFILLPVAQTILITFPIYGKGGSTRLVQYYKETHTGSDPHFIQLGSTGIYNGDPTLVGAQWFDRHSPYDTENKRAIAEDELLSLSGSAHVTVLLLCGLWGGQRSVRNWVGRIAPSKEVLKGKTSLHMIHGSDVARVILVVHEKFDLADGSRWLLTDGRVYDIWDLVSAWGDAGYAGRGKPPTGPHPKWVQELMDEHNVRALPRGPEQLGKTLDSREFWTTFGLTPNVARLEI